MPWICFPWQAERRRRPEYCSLIGFPALTISEIRVHCPERLSKESFFCSADIFDAVTFLCEELFDPFLVIALEFNRITLDRSSAGELPFQVL
jgi:hypothetical protein